MNEIEQTLIKKIQQEDDEAFLLLTKQYAPRIFRFLLSLVKNRGDAEDLSQDVFFKAWKNIKNFDPEKDFAIWLFVIAKNTAFDWLKKKKSFSVSDVWTHEEWVLQTESIPDEKPLPQELFERKELAEEFSKIFENFDVFDRAILSLRYQDEHTFEEIAVILGKPMNTVKSRHRRVLLALRERLLHQKESIYRTNK